MKVFYIVMMTLAYGVSVRSQGALSISFSPVMAGQPLELGNRQYHTATGDSFSVDAFRFYISGIVLNAENGTAFIEKDSYHLIDAEDSATQTIVLKNVPTGLYTSIGFYIGTDSLTNVSGAMGGDLDPTKGMYWAWNSGYINFKIEGKSAVCKTLHHAFEFHIGGYMPPYQTVRQIILPLKKVRVTGKKGAFVQINADLAQFFNHIDLAKTNQVMIPSRQATVMADYFKEVFRFF